VSAETIPRAGARNSAWLRLAPTAVLLFALGLHATGVVLDFRAAIRYPFGMDYGEGIVWQQALLIPGPHMYGASQSLPFIVFHYPPIYYFLVRAVRWIEPNFLAAGRLVSAVSALLIAVAAATLVRIASNRRNLSGEFAVAVATGLLILCLDPVRNWGSWMRVDAAAVALGMMGLVVAARADGRFAGVAAALLLCVAAVFTKQTQLPVGIAIFTIALLRNPRGALAAAAVAGAIGLGALCLLEIVTNGGFLDNIVGCNINRYALKYAIGTLGVERASLPFMGLMLVAAGTTVASLCRALCGRRFLARFRAADRATALRATLLVHFVLASLMLFTLAKSGSSTNYLLDWLCVGGVLVGIALSDLATSERWFFGATTLLILAVLSLPIREIPDQFPPELLDQQAGLVARIAAADKPVASEDMVLLMLAGRPVVFEPAIVTELAAVGRWNEAPLVDMIRTHGFAFMITTDDTLGGSRRRSAAVDAAMRAAYPHVTQIGALWLHQP
jgi:hypothetical protein